MSTFKHQITFMSSMLEGDHMIKKRVNRTVQFKELDESDKSQHALHFKIFSIYRSGGSELNPGVRIDTDALYEITVESIKLLVITDEHFTTSDLAEFLASSRGLLKFGLWFLENHIIPFIKEYNS